MSDPVPAQTATPIDDTPDSLAGGKRSEILDQMARAVGREWAACCRDDLQRQGRRVAGGWPGTIREARFRVAQGIQSELVRRKMPAITEAEHETAVHAVYASARAEWRRHLEPEEP